MSAQSHRSVIKVQLAPFWVYVWCLGNRCVLPASFYFVCSQNILGQRSGHILPLKFSKNIHTCFFFFFWCGWLPHKAQDCVNTRMHSDNWCEISLPSCCQIVRQFNNRSSVLPLWIIMWFLHTLAKKLSLTLLSNRQFNQCISQARYLPTTEAGNVLPSNHCDRQWEPSNEQHQHSDHSSVWMQQRWHCPVL